MSIEDSRRLASLRALIADDGYAMTFQSLGQYRAALLDAATNPPVTLANHRPPIQKDED